MPQALLSGGFRLSSLSAVGLPQNLATLLFSNTITVSVFNDQEVRVGTTTSEYLISNTTFSNMQLAYLQSDQIIRVNWGNIGNTSHVSLASAGMPGTHHLWMGSAISGPNNIHVANSGTSEAVVRVLMAQ